MKVELISYTTNPIQQMYLAATRCVTAGEVKPSDPETMKRVVEKCLNAGHLTIAEFVDFTFSIEGITRSCSHQLVRHRHASFCQMSERRVKIGTPEEYEIVKRSQGKDEIIDSEMEAAAGVITKYFGDTPNSLLADKKIVNLQYRSFLDYWEMIQNGVPVEQARAVLPECTLTNLYMHVNFRALIEMSRLRLCTKAEGEIRRLFASIRIQIMRLGGNTINPEGNFLTQWIVPKCHHDGRCSEDKSCGYYEKLLKLENDEGE